jgi:RNA polymerase sigma factor (sigma-70 family)
MVSRVASRYAGNGVQADDLRQIGAMAAVDAASRYDPSKNKQFDSWVYLCVVNRISDEARAERMRMKRECQLITEYHHDPVVAELSDSTIRMDNNAALTDPAALSADALVGDAVLVLGLAVRKLSPRLRALMTLLYSEGFTQSEVARMWVVSRQRIEQLKREALSQLREYAMSGTTRREILRGVSVQGEEGNNSCPVSTGRPANH